MPIDRRAFLTGLAAAAAAVGAGCSSSGDTTTNDSGTSSTPSTAAASTSSSSGAPSSSTGSSTSTSAAPPSTTGGPAAFVVRGPANSTSVALTFHTNGDLGLAQHLLDITTEHRARITNFIVGDWLAANPTWAKKLLDAGHELANHTYTHPTFSSLDAAGMDSEITRCRDVLAQLSGNGGRYFRPSGTDDGTSTPSPAILAAAGRAGYATVLGWDVEPFDYQDPGANAVASRVLSTVKGGSIVSLHFGHAGTVQALPTILDGLAAKKLTTVTVSELLR